MVDQRLYLDTRFERDTTSLEFDKSVANGVRNSHEIMKEYSVAFIGKPIR